MGSYLPWCKEEVRKTWIWVGQGIEKLLWEDKWVNWVNLWPEKQGFSG